VATPKTSPLDATGKAAEDAAKRNAKELAARKEEITLMRQQEDELLETAVFDPKKPEQPLFIDEIEELGVSVNNDKVIIRTITDIEEMTYGVGNLYTFKAGVKYSVPRDLADYLEGLGYIWRPN
jgi:hypothetical protein